MRNHTVKTSYDVIWQEESHVSESKYCNLPSQAKLLVPSQHHAVCSATAAEQEREWDPKVLLQRREKLAWYRGKANAGMHLGAWYP